MLNIVLIEDDPDESGFIRRAASRHPVQCRFTEFATIREAQNYFLEDSGNQADLVLLDMRVKSRRGCELARQMKSSPTYKFIPVIALSISSSKEDQIEAWEAGCDGYFCKPDTSEGYAFVLKSIMDYWFSPHNMARKHLMDRQKFTNSAAGAHTDDRRRA